MKKSKTIILLFGSTGDLAARKLLPSLSNLYKEKNINENTKIIAIGRKDYDDKTYLKEMNNKIKNNSAINNLKDILSYYKMDINNKEDYLKLTAHINKIKNEDSRVIAYLAISPELIEIVSKNISDSKLINKDNMNESIIFEKPFGNDLKSAEILNKLLWTYFKEEQIYRIDHYLGKEMVQNIMAIRFSNIIFEEVWSNKVIDNIKIIAKEDEGILERAGYYNASGAIRDMLQSHLLQILSLVAMEAPKEYSNEYIKNAKLDVLKKLTFDENDYFVGQYKGYLNEKDVPKDSKTETFVFLRVNVNTNRLKNVPIYLISGKKMNTKETKIEIEFKETPEQKKFNFRLSKNKLCINIYPSDGMNVSFNGKVPGLKNDIKPLRLDYHTKSHAIGNIKESYERLFLDAINKSKTLFTRWDEIEAMWKFTDKIKNIKKELIIYNDEYDLKKEVGLLNEIL